MSRIGKKPIPVPSGVTVTLAGSDVTVKGPKGELKHTLPRGISLEVDKEALRVDRSSDNKQNRAFHGLTRALLNNMVQGVKTPWSKILEVHGTGFGAVVQGDSIELDLGFSNKINVKIPQGLEVKAEKGRPTKVTITGPDKQSVGQLAAVIRSKRPPSPYSDNKGVRYRGEVIRKKAGKAFGDKK